MSEYIGKGKTREGKFGKYVALWQPIDSLKEAIRVAEANGQTAVRSDLTRMKEPDKNGNEFTIKRNDWVPTANSNRVAPKSQVDDSTDDLPF